MSITITQAKKMFQESLFDDSVINKYSSLFGDKEYQEFIKGGEHYNQQWAKFKALGYSLDQFINIVRYEWKKYNTSNFLLKLMFLYTEDDLRNSFIANDMLSQMVVIKPKTANTFRKPGSNFTPAKKKRKK